MEENLASEGRGTPVFFAGVYYAQVPIDLLKDLSVKNQAKLLFAILHSYCREKHLGKEPFSFVNQDRIAKEYIGCTQQYVSKLIKNLEAKGWLTTVRLGQGRPNIIVLHDKKGKRIAERQEMDFRRTVMAWYRERAEG